MELTVPIKVELDREKLQFLYDEGYQQGRADRENELKEAFNAILGCEYSWTEIIDKAE